MEYHPNELELGQRLDQYLVKQIPNKSRSMIQNLILSGAVKLNGQPAKPSHLLRQADILVWDEVPDKEYPEPQKIELDILYEDDDLYVINKPSDMAVHPTTVKETGTLVQGLIYKSRSILEAIYDQNSLISRLRPGIVHRLDKQTSGVMLVAKNKVSLEGLSNQFKSHQIQKKYLAILQGEVNEPVTIRTNLERQSTSKINKMRVSKQKGEGREAITHFKPLEKYYLSSLDLRATLVECQIETGRTHQIRIHSKYFSHPVLGDQIYFTKSSQNLSQKLGLQRQQLHAFEIIFTHPTSQQKMRFAVDLPKDMQETIQKLKNNNL
jgi:23S rRNA pseudouridine1911/1915/1917 synthase